MEWRVVKSRKGGLKEKRLWLLQYGKVRTTVNNFTRWKTMREYRYDTKEEAIKKRDEQRAHQKMKESQGAKNNL